MLSSRGFVRLSDGAVFTVSVYIAGVEEAGFSPFSGVNFNVKVRCGVYDSAVPEGVKKLVAGKPLMPAEIPMEGWEALEIVEQQPARAYEVVSTSKGEFLVEVVVEAVMASRNTMYRTVFDAPVYAISWASKVSWKPKGKLRAPPIERQEERSSSATPAVVKHVFSLTDEHRFSMEVNVAQNPLNPYMYFEVPSVRMQRELTYISALLRNEFPEIPTLTFKVRSGEPLNNDDMLWLEALARAAGWSVEDIVDEMKNLHRKPSERAERYKELFEKLYREAVNLLEEDSPQVDEKMWGAAVALIKLYASLKGFPLLPWAHDKLYSYAVRGVEREHRETFKDMVEAVEPGRMYYLKRELNPEALREYRRDALRLIEKAGEIVFELMRAGQKAS